MPISTMLEADALEQVAADTMVGGATLTKLLGTSAWYAPGASVAYLVDSILNDQKRIIPCSVYLEGEYNQEDICIGVPCVIGRSGLESIVDVNLTADEQATFNKSAGAVRNMNAALDSILS
jgi:malate dehydrogenase